ncbi:MULTISPECIES: GmrSD restriction endonuclease domain-containing protein [Flavobacterium]|uniref:DUF262 domain-containing protein n=1 Tax=Flavobacterium jumunjinense TaxID=998845 RepID=A0ABV5GK08_9FLAO|nr:MULTISPECIES: DUF262 domain-containing protein [Flavobacterium]
MSIENYNTFWSIINDNKIEIPTIQRDYTYGRKSATTIREKLVADIINSIIVPNPLNLDFVYGKLLGKENHITQERNKNNIRSLLKTIKLYASDLNIEISDEVVSRNAKLEGKINFIPLDGQQRLTTLFLIHWYIAQRNNDVIALSSLNKFSYSTRLSSKEFCKILCFKQYNFDSKTDSVSDLISNSEEYFSSWKKDPTVNSMLIVIDEIHKLFKSKDVDYKDCWNKLTNENLITFDFFDLDDFELTDDLYIKMNARGRHLTNFEIFKSWLIKDYDGVILEDDWKKKFDIKWYDLFWKAKEKSIYKIDSEFLQHFKILFLGDYMKSQNSNDSRMNDDAELENYDTETLDLDDFKSVIGILRKKDSNPLEIFQNYDLFKDKINEYVEILDLASSVAFINQDQLLKKYIDTDLFKLLFGEKLNKLTWWDTTLHYAITRYLLKVENNSTYFSEWVRVISNLIYNTKIDTPKLFIEAIRSIDLLIDRVDSKNIYQVINTLREEEMIFFSPSQKTEEIFKAQLIVQDNRWEKLFIEAENHIYFYGQIGFIFKLCNSPIDINTFTINYTKVASLFSEEVLNDTTFLLTRSLLAIGDCFYINGNERIFNSNVRGTLRNRTENWRKFFDSKLNFIETIINRPDFNANNIIQSLNSIIKTEFPNSKGKYHGKFVNNYKLFLYAKKNIIRQHNKNYYLLNSTRISGYFVELYTYAWFLKNEKGCSIIPKYEISYDYVKGQDNEPGIVFKKGDLTINLRRNHNTKKYYIHKEKQLLEFKTIEEFIDSIK